MRMKRQDRIIFALDVPTASEALRLVDELDGLISFYKIGLELLMGGGLGDLLDRLKEKQLFVDLKLPDDISATIKSVVRLATAAGVRFLTLSHTVGPATIQAAVEGRGGKTSPELLWVPFLSSLDETDFAQQFNRDPKDFHGELVRRSVLSKKLGIDGFIVSGQEIALLRKEFPSATLVSPGIRPAWASKDGHKRTCTPSEALRLGADHIVIGRPIRDAGDRQARRAAATRILNEIAEVEESGPSSAKSSLRSPSDSSSHIAI
jgi:orotidine-5'-phosphate decarboxylase